MLPTNLKLKEHYDLFIYGKWVKGTSGESVKAYCPATGDYLTSFTDASREDVDLAVKAAHKAFASWSKSTPKERAAILNKIADRIDEQKEELALIESVDNGKPLRETLNIDIPYSATHNGY